MDVTSRNICFVPCLSHVSQQA